MINIVGKIRFLGFSLIELMIVVTIIGILAAIAIPTYSTYVRKSRTAEASSNISSIAQYEEQYYSENNKYYGASGNPATVPNANSTGGVLPFNTTSADWVELGAIFTNNTQLRFQYRAFAGQFTAVGGDATGTGLTGYATSFAQNAVSGGGSDTCSNVPAGSASYYGITQTNFSNWYVVTAMGNQRFTPASKCSIFVKVNDRSAIFSQDPTE